MEVQEGGDICVIMGDLPAMQETWAGSLGWEDPLEKEMTTNSNILVENPMDKRAWWATVHGVAESDMTEQLMLPLSKHFPQ